MPGFWTSVTTRRRCSLCGPGDETRHVPLANILFFETAPKAHHVFLHTADRRLDFVGSLKRPGAGAGRAVCPGSPGLSGGLGQNRVRGLEGA